MLSNQTLQINILYILFFVRIRDVVHSHATVPLGNFDWAKIALCFQPNLFASLLGVARWLEEYVQCDLSRVRCTLVSNSNML